MSSHSRLRTRAFAPNHSPRFVRKLAITTAGMIVLAGAGCLPPGSQISPTSGQTCSIPTSSGGAGSQLKASVRGSYLSDASGTASARSRKASQRLVSHVPAAALAAQDLGVFSDSESLDLTVSLPLNHTEELERLIGALHDPSSPQFGHYLKPQEFAERFGPTAEQVAAARGYLESQGLSVGSVSPNGKLMHVSGAHRFVSSAFATEVHRFADSSGKVFFAPKYELEIPAGVPIEAVHGLHNLVHYKSHAHERPGSAASPLSAGSGPNGGVSPSDLRTAYRFPSSSTYDGSGQKLALFELDGYSAADISAYETVFGLPHVPLNNVLVDGAQGTAGQGAGEVTLDIELMIAAAPGASQVIVYEGPNSDQGVLETYNRIATDDSATAVSTSWGSPEDQSVASTMQAEQSIFMQMAAQGQTIYAAAGDSGAFDDGKTISVDDPASQPYVVGVGGTRLSTDGNGNYLGETTWNGGTPQSGAGGGGISTLWTIPSWQQAAATASQALGSAVSTTMRNVPDVSLDADPQTGYAIYFQGQWTIFGGTSCAAPIYAGFTALVNQARAAHGLGALGLPQPALYQLGGQTSNYSADFNDVADGSTNLFYHAVTGYDDATGLGSLKADGLLADLAQVARATVSAPGSSNNSSCGP